MISENYDLQKMVKRVLRKKEADKYCRIVDWHFWNCMFSDMVTIVIISDNHIVWKSTYEVSIENDEIKLIPEKTECLA